jgi:hypothetical protein
MTPVMLGGFSGGCPVPDRPWASFEQILEGYPDLEREDFQQAIEYAAWLTQEQAHISH